MTLNIDQDEYLGSVAQEAGVRVVVHSQDRMPFPEDEGVSVMPGQITYIGMRLVSLDQVSPVRHSCCVSCFSAARR